MVSTNEQSSVGESEGLPAAASNAMQVPGEFATIPADAWQEVDRAMRSLLGLGLRPCEVDNALQLRQRYGIPVKAIRRYARQLAAAGALPAGGSEARTLAQANVLTRMPSSTQRLLDTLLRDLAVSIHTRLGQPDLPVDQAADLLNAFARHQQALTRRHAQKIQAHKYYQEVAARRRQQAEAAEQERQKQRRKARRRQSTSEYIAQITSPANAVPDHILRRMNELRDLNRLDGLTPSRKARDQDQPDEQSP